MGDLNISNPEAGYVACVIVGAGGVRYLSFVNSSTSSVAFKVHAKNLCKCINLIKKVNDIFNIRAI